ncbi:MAG TPA: hypothetical protein VII99_15275 [Bacteroidia bacterium]
MTPPSTVFFFANNVFCTGTFTPDTTAPNSKLPLLPAHSSFEILFLYLCFVTADNFSLRKSATTAICGTLATTFKRHHQLTAKLFMPTIACISTAVLFSCGSEPRQTFSIPDSADINSIVWTVITEDSLPVLKSFAKTDTLKYGDSLQATWVHTAFPFSIELRKIKVIVSIGKTSDTSNIPPPPPPPPPPSWDAVSFSQLFYETIDGKRFFDNSDSLYFLFQNDTLRQFCIADSIANKLVPTTFIAGQLRTSDNLSRLTVSHLLDSPTNSHRTTSHFIFRFRRARQSTTPITFRD